MKCELARNLMSSYIDKDINEIDRVGLEKHIQQCQECREEYELLLEIITDCNNFEEVDLPDDFHQELHQRLLNEKSTSKSKVVNFANKFKWKAASGLVAAVLIVAITWNNSSLLLGQAKKAEESTRSSAAAPSYDMANTFDTQYNEHGQEGVPTPKTDFDKAAGNYGADSSTIVTPQFTEAASDIPKIEVTSRSVNDIAISFSEALTEGASPTADKSSYTISSEAYSPSRAGDRKIIKSGSLSLKVADLNSKVDELKTIADQSGGYVENSQVNNHTIDVVEYRDAGDGKVLEQTITKTANVVIRVPDEQFDDIVNDIKEMGDVQSENISGSDITSQYRDTEAVLANLKLEENKLQDLMTNKATTVDEILRIETELRNVRTSIDITEGSLRHWDALVQLSTIYINLTEVKREELKKVDVPGAWEKAQKGFVNTLNNISKGLEWIFIKFIASIPYLLIFGVPALILIYSLIRKRRKLRA